MRHHTLYLPDLLNIVDLPDADIRRLTRWSARLGAPGLTQQSAARRLGRAVAGRPVRTVMQAIAAVLGIGLAVWALSVLLSRPPESIEGRLSRAGVLLAGAGVMAWSSLSVLQRARARAVLIAAASRARRFNPDHYAERLRRMPDPADPSLNVWKRELFPSLTVLQHLVVTLRLAQAALIGCTTAPLALGAVYGAIAGGAERFPIGIVVLGMTLGLLTLVLTLALGPAAIRQRVETRIGAKRCSHCGYSLGALVQDQRGPRRCPECGCPWPLLVDDRPRW